MRRDLLSLSEDDLSDISNRGNVKRATKELDRTTYTYQIETSEREDVTFTWSDEIVCVLRADALLADAECSCPAPGVCRHIVRSILAYQRENSGEVETVAEIGPWNPGTISDDTIGKTFTKRQIKQAEKARDSGTVIELIRGRKPTARFHRLGHTIRFMVPDDPRYVQCDCQFDAPCWHTALAIWAFRDMGDELTDILDTFDDDHDDSKWLAETDLAIRKIVGGGLGTIVSSEMDRLSAFERDLRAAGHLWLSEILSDLRSQHEHYLSHDARFSPRILADCVGEAMIRHDALKNPDLEIPKLFVRGQVVARETSIGQSRLVGLGCKIVQHAHGVEIIAMLQDMSSGKLHALTKYFADPEEEDKDLPTYTELARRLVVHGRDYASIGRSQLVIKSAKLSADHKLQLGRGAASTYAQNFEWEDLRPPVGATSFAEIRSRLAILPPASLRPRVVGEDFHTCPVARCENVQFSERDQTVRATLFDRDGNSAELFHPFTNRGGSGTERLLNWLLGKSKDVRFVSGTMRLGPSGLIVEPASVVFQVDDARKVVQPWVDDMDEWLETAQHTLKATKPSRGGLAALRQDFADAVGDAILLGSEEGRRIDNAWRTIAARANDLSIALIADASIGVVKSSDAEWVDAVMNAAIVSRLAQELA